MGTTGDFQTIDGLAMDALVDGLSKSLNYLEDQRGTVLGRVGDLMLQYLIEAGSVSSPDKPDAFAQSLGGLVTKNGYGDRINVQFEGTPPRPSFPDLVDYLSSRGSRDEGSRVDWVLYEALLYGMTKALDELGLQAQRILARVGTGMLDYLVVEGAIEPSDDPNVFFAHISEFFMRSGYAGSFEFKLEGSPPHTLISTYGQARYYENVLKRLRNEGSALFSCPMCLAGQSVFEKTQGIKIQYAVEFRMLPDGMVTIRNKMYPATERFNEEKAEEMSRLMG
jgi:hypothetical protein